MTSLEKEYYGYINNLKTMPINFIYDDVFYSGFDMNNFEIISKEIYQYEYKEVNNITLLFKEKIHILIIL